MSYPVSMLLRSMYLILALMASAPLAAGEVVPAAINDLLAKHCVECHGRDQPKAGLDLVSLLTQSAAKNLEIWRKVGQAVRTGDMPPSKRPRLDPLGSDQLRTWIEAQLAAAVDVRDPGPAALRRLTSHELTGSLHALTGVEFPEVVQLMPKEARGGEGFAGIGSIQATPPEQIEGMVAVARYVANRLVVGAAGLAFVQTDCSAGGLTTCIEQFLDLRRGEWHADIIARLGEAVVELRAGGDLAGISARYHLPPERIQAFDVLLSDRVPNADSLGSNWPKVRVLFDAAIDPKLAAAERHARLRAWSVVLDTPNLIRDNKSHPPALKDLLESGMIRRHREIAGWSKSHDVYQKPTWRPVYAEISALLLPDQFTELRLLSDLALEDIAFNSASEPIRRHAWMKVTAEMLAARASARIAAEPEQRAWLASFAARAWRRPLVDGEREALFALYDQSRSAKLDHIAALRLTVVRVLASPEFWYHSETIPAERYAPLTSRDLAQRLSYTLCCAPPDAELTAAAVDGSLVRNEVLSAQTRRLLADPAAVRGLVDGFALVWFGLDGFVEADPPDLGRFKQFTPSLAQRFLAETRQTIADILRNNGKISDLISGDWTYLDADLARHYGVTGLEMTVLRRVDGAKNRGGILGQGAILVRTSYALRTSPVKRGSWLLQDILGRILPPPPADAGLLPSDDKVESGTKPISLKQRLERHRRDPSCAACHQHIDPIGFPLECFDVIGQLRNRDVNGQPLDFTGTFEDGTTIAGFEALRGWLAGQQQRFITQFARKLAGYALGRTITAGDQHLVDAMIQASTATEGRLWPMVETLIQSTAFRQRRGLAFPAH